MMELMGWIDTHGGIKSIDCSEWIQEWNGDMADMELRPGMREPTPVGKLDAPMPGRKNLYGRALFMARVDNWGFTIVDYAGSGVITAHSRNGRRIPMCCLHAGVVKGVLPSKHPRKDEKNTLRICVIRSDLGILASPLTKSWVLRNHPKTGQCSWMLYLFIFVNYSKLHSYTLYVCIWVCRAYQLTLKWLCPCSPEVGPQRQCGVAKRLQGAPIVPGKLVTNHFLDLLKVHSFDKFIQISKLCFFLRFQECKPDQPCKPDQANAIFERTWQYHVYSLCLVSTALFLGSCRDSCDPFSYGRRAARWRGWGILPGSQAKVRMLEGSVTLGYRAIHGYPRAPDHPKWPKL